MVILKKIRAATLAEQLVASAIIMVIFSIASLSLNNVFQGAVKGKDSAFQNRIKELTYFTQKEKLNIPFYEENDRWDIAIEEQEGVIYLEALHKPSKKNKKIKIVEKP